MFNFTEKSYIAITWAGKVLNGEYTLEQVPDLFNLREVVKSIIEKEGGEK